MSENTLAFLLTTVERFEANSLPVRVFGGWAEELWQIIQPRVHTDIDFLYPAATFEDLDRYIARTNEFQEIQSKRFSHKRAILYQQVMIEFLLVQRSNGIYFTDFFSGQFHLEWPADLFWHRINISGHDLQIASKQALILYRQHHKQVEQAYLEFLIATDNSEMKDVSLHD
jgi:hypothetical protein